MKTPGGFLKKNQNMDMKDVAREIVKEIIKETIKKLKVLPKIFFYCAIFSASATLVILLIKNLIQIIMKNLIFFLALMPTFLFAQDTTITICDLPFSITIPNYPQPENCFVDVVGEIDPNAISYTIFYRIGGECCFYENADLLCCQNKRFDIPEEATNGVTTENTIQFIGAVVDLECLGSPRQIRIINNY